LGEAVVNNKVCPAWEELMDIKDLVMYFKRLLEERAKV
jgi:hypothetical protein